ncbi:Basement membrane-specific heparan sulfate proteoglycan core protein [Merluccius polli]|uniref:B-cell receptor CD22 n=1 Tax=Merluccius polli TaxID=89951 RepID=A0AA47MTI7_MERPO|nr:Basement membrane-specific heparan sulfate proteoglycan core protein [Merluccius polli]
MKCNSTDAPKTTSAAVSTSGEIEEGRSVTLSCSSDANPAANYTWFKVNTDHSSRDMNQGQQLVFGAILSSDSGQYLCKAKNELGTTSDSISINVKYGPKNTSVISSPSGEIEEGRSVTLSCSSDANPAANYTWFKEHEDSEGESGQNYTITNITSQLGGNYYCQAHNAVGRNCLFKRHTFDAEYQWVKFNYLSTQSNTGLSMLQFVISDLCFPETSSQTVISVAGGTVAVLLTTILLFIILWMRRKMVSRKASGLGGRPDAMEESLPVPVYDNVLRLTNRTAPAAQREPIEERDDLHYASVHVSRSKNQEVPLCMAGSRVQSDQTDEVLYSVVNGNNDWTVTYTSSNVCSLRGSTVDITCTYRYPDELQYLSTLVETLWFTKEENRQPVDLLSVTDYAGRVEYTCGEISYYWYDCRGRCTLRITDLRQSDSAVYKFRFITNQPGGQYTGEPGVKLSVTDLQVKVIPSRYKSKVDLKCDSTCGLAGYPAYIWYMNGQSVGGITTRDYRVNLNSEESYSCAVKGYEHLHSPLVFVLYWMKCNPTDAPKTTSATVSPSGEIEEGRSVTLSCSSDANPAANYTWFKVNTDQSSRDMIQGQQLVFGAILSSDSGQYLCKAKNELGTTSDSISINVKYGPKNTSVISSPSGEIEEGRSVTLSCSSDANPAANYTWFKEHEDSVGESGQNYTITHITSQLGGNYYCQAHNAVGRHNSTFLFIHVTVSMRCVCFFTALQGNDDWTVTYTSSNVCALRGSTVDITCTYQYPYKLQYRSSLWFTKEDNKQRVNLLSDTDYAGRVEYTCGEISCYWYNCRRCTLRIRDLRQSDSAVYKFRFITNQPGGQYTGEPGVTLSVTDLQVKVIPSHHSSWVYLTCDSTCGLAGYPAYIWYMNGQSVRGQTTWYYGVYLNSEDSYSCAVEGYEHLHSPLVCKSTPQYTDKILDVMDLLVIPTCIMNGQTDHVLAAFRLWVPVDRYYTLWKDCGGDQSYRDIQLAARGPNLAPGIFVSYWMKCNSTDAPKTTSATVSPSGEIEEGRSVTLSCSSDANPAANYTWFKVNTDHSSRDMIQGQQLVFGAILSSDSGQYLCKAKNELGTSSDSISINVKYGPKNTSVISSPSGEIEEGRSVTLSCSSDANPAANYTWFKEHEDSVGESGQNYTITHITSQLGGNYYCQAHNAVGRNCLFKRHTFDAEYQCLKVNYLSTQSNTGLSMLQFVISDLCFPETSSQTVISVAGRTVAVLLTTIFLFIILWMRRKMASRKASGLGGRPDAMEESLPVPVYDNVIPLTNRTAPVAQREPIEERDDLHYASVHISRSKNQEVPLCMAGSRVQSDQTDEVLYSVGNDDWTVTYTSSNVCSLRGSAVDITCTYRYPEKQYRSSLWFTKEDNKQPVNLLSDTDYAGRVEYTCGEISCYRYNCKGRCTLRIRDLRQSDSAVYKFRFIKIQPGGQYTGEPGVTLSVTDPDLQVKVMPSSWLYWVYLKCDSTCGLAGYPAYIWYKNGQSVGGITTRYYSVNLNSEDSYSCAVKGYEHLHSPLVCKSTPQYTDKIPDVMDLLVIPTCIMNGQTDHVLAAFRLWVPVDRYYTLWKDCGGDQSYRDIQLAARGPNLAPGMLSRASETHFIFLLKIETLTVQCTMSILHHT